MLESIRCFKLISRSSSYGCIASLSGSHVHARRTDNASGMLADSFANQIFPRLSSSKRRLLEISRRQFSSQVRDTSRDPVSHQIQLDFFGEPVTFLSASSTDHTTNAMAALDGFLLAVVSKGKTCTDGGEEAGLHIKSIHSAAVSWAELLRHATTWSGEPSVANGKAAPLLAHVAVAPILAGAGVAYVKHLDSLLSHAKPAAPGLPVIQMIDLAASAVARKDDDCLNRRERLHLEALEALLQDDHSTALAIILRILRLCPGDTLALSLAMDLSQTTGDKDAALRAAGTVSQYWHERRGGMIRPAMPGHSLASSLMALGLAVGGRHEEAEQIAANALKQGKSVAGGIATWAQAHVFDASGRVSEGISALANFDGVANYMGSGLFHFDCRLGGYGARFHLDREERGRGMSKALRLYEENFDRVLDYSGFAQGRPWQRPVHKAPLPWSEVTSIAEGDKPKSLFDKLFRNDEEIKEQEMQFEIITKQSNSPSLHIDNLDPSVEDILTWIPPTPMFLTEATMLLMRFTLNGTISRKHPRWDNLRKAWEATLSIQKKYSTSLSFCPIASVAASLLLPPTETGGDAVGNGAFGQGLFMLGEKLQLGNWAVVESDEETGALAQITADREPDFWLPVLPGESQNDWKLITDSLATAIDGVDCTNRKDAVFDHSLQFRAWTFDARPILEHAIVYAACKAGDIESLCLARSICSQGVTIRSNSPEEWWRYSIVLGLLGDEVASENALNNSINLGGGQGARAA
ncbi:hypothetical protein MPSEU_000715300 [Mayamaea pseudoterrestris]|nr:hypothetical protein MPSEU_000715300 [Mayamaea pseudoterrestris]